MLVTWNLFLLYLLTVSWQFNNDFGRFYYSASAFLQGHDIYGLWPSDIAPKAALPELQHGNLNPPHFHLLLLPLMGFPPLWTLALWGIASLISLFASLRLIVKEVALPLTPRLWRMGVLSLLGFSGTGMVLVTGQLAFLLLLPVTWAWISARRGRWTNAGVQIGLAMSIKPFLLLFLPYFLFRRQLRATVAAAMTVGLCFTVGVLVFGVEAHQQWLHTLRTIHWAGVDRNISILGFLIRMSSHNPSVAPLSQTPNAIEWLWIVLSGLVGLFTFGASLHEATPKAIDRQFALMILAALLISPLSWPYYWWLPLGPFVALAVTWRQDQQRPLPVSFPVYLRNIFLCLALPGLFWPSLATALLPAQRWARASIGSIYFWTTLFLWLSLIADWRVANKRGGK
jgi:alpha-1,2-mannosyltransferase